MNNRNSNWTRWWALTNMGLDIAALGVAMYAAAAIRFGPRHALELVTASFQIREVTEIPWLPSLILWFIALGLAGCYSPRIIRNNAEELRRVLVGSSAGALAVVLFSYVVKVQPSRIWLATSTVLCVAAVWGVRRVSRAITAAIRRRGRWMAGCVVVSRDSSAELSKRIGSDPMSGLSPRAELAIQDGDPSALRDRLHQLVVETGSTAVVIDAEGVSRSELDDLASVSDTHPLELLILSGLDYSIAQNLAFADIGGATAMSVDCSGLRVWQRATKRAVDLGLTVPTAIAALPVGLIIGAAIRIADGPGVIHRQTRVGRRGDLFTMYKFRTMSGDAPTDVDTLPGSKPEFDPRVTKLGRRLRRWSLDELPQLLNVLKGDMSVVGPRPALPDEVPKWEDKALRRLDVPPGLTGLWQVNGRSDLTMDEYVRLDLTYVRSWSLALDLYIIARTIPAVVAGRGAY